MTDRDIIDRLLTIRQTALALYSGFKVAALLETDDGKLISGVNIESSSYGLTICAERVAMFKALSEGHRRFSRIYLMCDGLNPCSPCGACRQILMDFAPDIEVLMYSENGQKKSMPVQELLPAAFTSKNLE